MGTLFGILTGPVKNVFDGVAGILDKVVTTDKEKLDAKGKLLDIERLFQTALMAADAEFAKSQADVIKTEAQSESWLAANWRPILMLTFTFIIAWNYIIFPIVSAFTHRIVPVVIPPDMWDLLKLGVTGYITGRSVEKGIRLYTESKK